MKDILRRVVLFIIVFILSWFSCGLLVGISFSTIVLDFSEVLSFFISQTEGWVLCRMVSILLSGFLAYYFIEEYT